MNINDSNGGNVFEQLNLTQPAQTSGANQALGQDDFLQLMTTQLQNQDPFAPLENGDFIAQIAQFGTVTGIESLNESFSGLSESLTSNRALEASVMVGRKVLVPSATNSLTPGEPMQGAVDLPASSNNVSVKILNANGEVVATRVLGPQPRGLVDFEWDGLDSNGDLAPAGQYFMQGEAEIGGDVEQVGTLASGNVDSVSLGTGLSDFTLHVAGIGDVRLADVREINA